MALEFDYEDSEYDPLSRAGLDTFAARTPDEDLNGKDLEAFENANIHLMGGLFSHNGGSFHGKHYATLVSYITDESLYQEWIAPETVGEMAEALRACDPEQVLVDIQNEVWRSREYTVNEIVELRRFFVLCADLGLGLKNWF